jgi:hypothetical protein
MTAKDASRQPARPQCVAEQRPGDAFITLLPPEDFQPESKAS